jgi:hypothetical protein
VRSWLLSCCVFFIACGEAPTSHDAGTSGGDAGTSCIEPDRECPLDPPLIGSPCEGTLVCPFDGGGTATCAGGEWLFDTGCDGGGEGGGGCAPPLAEVCRDPFTGSVSDARVEVGPVEGVFRPFSANETVTAEFGSQGGGMIAYRVRIDGVEVAPECIDLRTTVTLDDSEPLTSHRGITLHCGHSLGVFDILAESPCESRSYPVTLRVEVAGVGSATANLDLMGGACPRTF